MLQIESRSRSINLGRIHCIYSQHLSEFERVVIMGKKSKRHAAHSGTSKPAAGSLINNKTVCKVVEELWTSEQHDTYIHNVIGNTVPINTCVL